MSKEKKIEIYQNESKKQIITTFFLDSVSAGFPSPATDYMENKLDLNEYLIKHPAATFIVKASGTSMSQAGILSGDLLIVDRSISPSNDNIVIASIFGDLTVKKILKKKKSLFLISANDEYPSIEVKETLDSINTMWHYFEGYAEDDYGVKELLFKYRFLDDTSKWVSDLVQLTNKSNKQGFSYAVNFQSLGLKYGFGLEYFFEVWDNDGIKVVA